MPTNRKPPIWSIILGTISWVIFEFADYFGRLAYALDRPKSPLNFWCRFNGHPNGEIYYTTTGDEPDHRCQDCGEHIG